MPGLVQSTVNENGYENTAYSVPVDLLANYGGNFDALMYDLLNGLGVFGGDDRYKKWLEEWQKGNPSPPPAGSAAKPPNKVPTPMPPPIKTRAYADGGDVDRTGPAFLHGGEHVLTAVENAVWGPVIAGLGPAHAPANEAAGRPSAGPRPSCATA